MRKMDNPESFQKQLEKLININSMENASNTPDFILAKYINSCLYAFIAAVNEREAWYGRGPWMQENYNAGEDCEKEEDKAVPSFSDCFMLSNIPEYKSHKKVKAAKIIFINKDSDIAKRENRDTDGSAVLTLEGSYHVEVNHEYMFKHKPEIGGFYVLYEDGYESWSPAKAFEEGYKKI